MSERTNVPGDSAWHQIGTGPASVQNLSVGVSIMLVCSATEPTGVDGIVLVGQGSEHTFQLTNAIWAQVVQSGASAIVAVQPE